MSNTPLDLSRVPDHLRVKLESQLSRLPTEIRNALQTQLAKLPPEQLAQLLEHGSPMLDKILGRAEKATSTLVGRKDTAFKPAENSIKPVGHYNQTVQAGDQPGLVSKILFGIGLAALLYYFL